MFTFGSHALPFCAWFTAPSNMALTSSAEQNPEKAWRSSTLLIDKRLNVSATAFPTPSL